MKRTERIVERALDISPLIRAIQFLDEALKRGVVIGVYEDSMEVSDEDVWKAIGGVKLALTTLTNDMERTLRMANRVAGEASSQRLQ